MGTDTEMDTDTARALSSSTSPPGIGHLPGRPARNRTASMVGGANLTVRLVVELAAYASLGWWGAALGSAPMVDVVLAVAAPLAAILVWVRYLAPKARKALPDPAALVVELIVFATAALALAGSGQVALAVAFAAVATANTFLVRILGLHHLDGSP
jgi:hypothetical protein